MTGSCPTWETFFSSKLLLPTDEVEFVSVLANFQLFDYTTKRNLTQSFICKRKNIVQSLISAMSFGTSYEANCEGNSWRTYRYTNSWVINAPSHPLFIVVMVTRYSV